MPESPAIYVDILFLINLLMDYTILWASARFAQIKFAQWRIISAACLGSLYSIIVLIPNFNFLSDIWSKFIVSVLMILISFVPLPLKKIGQVFLYFYLIAFVMGGTVLGLIYFISNSSVNSPFAISSLPYLWLLIAVGIAFYVGTGGIKFLRKTFLQELLKVPILIRVKGQEIKIDGLVDTGNQLIDPLTGNPVIIVEYDVLKSFLPQYVDEIFSSGEELDLDKIIKMSCNYSDSEPLLIRLIPFTTIGKRYGMLLGFKPDEIYIFIGDQTLKRNNVIVGIYKRRLSPKGTYQALLHPDLIQAPGFS